MVNEPVNELVLGIVRARLENDHEMVTYYMDQLNGRAQLWSAKHIFDDLSNTAEAVYRGEV